MNTLHNQVVTPARKGRYRWTWLSVVLILLMIVVLIFMVKRTRDVVNTTDRGQVLSVAEGSILFDAEGGNRVGTSRREKRDSDWYVFVSVKLDDPSGERSYHAWLENPQTNERRYMGELFKVQDGEWSVTYTTQEDVSVYTDVLISREDTPQPVVPDKSITSWAFTQ